MNSQDLKIRQRDLRNRIPTPPEQIELRLHRSISWLARAEQSEADKDAQFIFLWVAFNAAYASNQTLPDISLSDFKVTEKDAQSDFFVKIVNLDEQEIIYKVFWKEFSGPVRSLMKNQYIFSLFWQNEHNPDTQQQIPWQQAFDSSDRHFIKSFQKGDAATVLRFTFSRLYTLRNQIIHGGSTWNSSVNRQQIKDGASILSRIVPLFIDIMLNNPMEDWGEPLYQPVNKQHPERGVRHVKQIKEYYEAEEIVFEHKVIMFSLNQSILEKNSVYEAARYAWKLNPDKATQAELALALEQGLVIGVFVPERWLEANEANFPGREPLPGRWGFAGREAAPEIGKIYLRKKLPADLRKKGASNPVRYSY